MTCKQTKYVVGVLSVMVLTRLPRAVRPYTSSGTVLAIRSLSWELFRRSWSDTLYSVGPTSLDTFINRQTHGPNDATY